MFLKRASAYSVTRGVITEQYELRCCYSSSREPRRKNHTESGRDNCISVSLKCRSRQVERSSLSEMDLLVSPKQRIEVIVCIDVAAGILRTAHKAPGIVIEAFPQPSGVESWHNESEEWRCAPTAMQEGAKVLVCVATVKRDLSHTLFVQQVTERIDGGRAPG